MGLLLVVSVGSITVARGADVCPANPSPPDAADPSISVDSPSRGDTVSSPVSVEGKARVFEANVRITVFDAAGHILADTFTTAAEGAPALAPFATSVAFNTAEQQQGCIRVFEESARDGSPRNVVQVEVNLAPPMAPPNTGSGGLEPDSENDHHLALYAAGFLALLGAAALALERRLWW